MESPHTASKLERRRLLKRRLRTLAIVSLLATILPTLSSLSGLHTTFVVMSDSMTPTLKAGDILITSPASGNIVNGTIIVFKSPLGGFEAHRVVGCTVMADGAYYQTKGDANKEVDSFLISSRKVIGPVLLTIPYLGLYFLIPREIALVATLTLTSAYLYLTFRSENTSTQPSTPQQRTDRRKRTLVGALLLTNAILLSSIFLAQSSLRLVYPVSSKTFSLATPPIALQQGTTGTSTIQDGGNRATVTVTAPIATTWLSGWYKRVKITIDHTDVSSTLSNFPVLVHLSTSSGRNHADVSFIFNELQSDSNRKKIAITLSNGITQCYVEVERWDHQNRQAWLWVKVPTVSSATDTVLYLYYDKDQADNTNYVGDPNSAAGEQVWDTNHQAVHHMEEDPTMTITDSTSKNIDMTSTGMTSANLVDAKVGKGVDFDGVDDAYTSQASITFTRFTYSAWIKGDSYSTWRTVAAVGQERDLCLETGILTFWANGAGYRFGSALTTGAWDYVVVTYDGTTLRGWIDGTATSQTYTLTLGSYTGTLQFGRWQASYDYFDGVLDEIRVSNNARSGAWTRASYESERDDFNAFGSEELCSYDYVLKVSNQGSSTWSIYLAKSSDSNLARLSNVTIWFHDGSGVSRQIQVINGGYTQTTGSPYSLPAAGTVYIAIRANSSSTGASTIIVNLEATITSTGIKEELTITFNIN